MFFEPGVPIRVEMNARRTEAIFPFPMSIAVLRARGTAQVSVLRLAQCGDSIQEIRLRFNFKSDIAAKQVFLMLLRERSGRTDRGYPRASGTRRAEPERKSRRKWRRSPSNSRGSTACAAARSCRSGARWPCAPRPPRT